MLETWQGIALVGATVLTGLMAGLYFAFSVAVLPGLGREDARTFVAAMQGINVKILNAWFAVAFAGAALVTAAAAVLLPLGGGAGAAAPWTVAALVLYSATLVITFRWNVPLNEALDAADGSAPQQAREGFERRWVRWNHARAVLCTVALVCLAVALTLYGGSRT